ncbi:acetyl-CoA carboxylase biotin carboxylase subunit [Curvivirga aplysinae]|uniref:acetyl-CoA carboxylase biotin carboxylase subunit n=1 Tax=Curvivirga aplysinae TaxID=2529852 RepID=UPI002E271E59|nr:acetyl-CoA carboxylase biotin carboxylase subunit [Curvivirga aplysinae]
MFKKVLIANRGEIALRIHRACKEMGIQTVAIHSTADENAMHVRLADEAVCIGPPSPAESYLNKAAILTAANITGADAIHPGVGFLSENAEFAEMVVEHGHTWIGPSPAHLRMMGDKIEAKEAAKRLGIPVVPGSDGGVDSEEDALRLAKEIGFPLIIKAASGGGGRGMKVANSINEVAEAYNICRTEAKVAFGDDAVYMERYLGEPRHIEVQLIADGQGGCVHLWERDCSVQRRHQKVIEEAPSPALDQAAREKIGKTVTDAMVEMGYASAGTIEFLYERGEFFFIEMNTRLQVEHPISEMICGVDLVREQIRVAAGHKLSFKQEDIKLNGHSIECRVTAEHPETFMPSPGKICDYHAPGGLGVRVDSHLYTGYSIPPYYDSLVSKLIVHGDSREECLKRLDRALGEYVIGGIQTTIPLHQKLIHEEAFKSGDYDIHWLEKLMGLK